MKLNTYIRVKGELVKRLVEGYTDDPAKDLHAMGSDLRPALGADPKSPVLVVVK